MSVPLSCLFFQLSVRTERVFPLSHECGMCTLAEGPSGLLPLSTDASSLHLKKGQSPSPGASSAHTFFPAGPLTSTCRHAVRVDRVWVLGSERSASEHSLHAYRMPCCAKHQGGQDENVHPFPSQTLCPLQASEQKSHWSGTKGVLVALWQ